MFRSGILLFVTLIVGTELVDPYGIRTYSPLIQARIFGGHDANITSFPHQVSIKVLGYHHCGGSIYKSNMIITAAHCFNKFKSFSIVEVAAGSSLVNENPQMIPIKECIIHEKYNNISFDNDIAILVLDGNLEFNDKVQPIVLSTKRPPPKSKVIATGWGLSGIKSYPIMLKQVEIEVVDQIVCKEIYKKISSDITDNMLCAGHSGSGKTVCDGDSGGPLIYKKELLGVVSSGMICGNKEFPDVYTSIPDVYDWILNVIAMYEEK